MRRENGKGNIISKLNEVFVEPGALKRLSGFYFA